MKRFLVGAVVLCMLFSILLQGVSAAGASEEEKRKLAEAAGETIPVQTNETNVKIKKRRGS